MQITLNDETLEKLKSVVSFENDGAVYAFLADAINTYVELGRISHSGYKFFAGETLEGEMRRVVMPFEDITPPAEDEAEEPAEKPKRTTAKTKKK